MKQDEKIKLILPQDCKSSGAGSGKFNPIKLDANSVLAQEIRYLQRHGYSWTDDFSRMIKK